MGGSQEIARCCENRKEMSKSTALTGRKRQEKMPQTATQEALSPEKDGANPHERSSSRALGDRVSDTTSHKSVMTLYTGSGRARSSPWLVSTW